MRLLLHSFASVWLLSLCFFASISRSDAAIYYVSPSGNDSNSGLSTSLPWKTLTKVNGHTFAAGDQCLFQSGQTFTAPTRSDALIIKGAGTSTSPIVYGIYGGTAPAIISQTSASYNGITFSPTNSYVTIQDLTVAGPFVWSPTTIGAATPYGIYLQGSSSKALTGTTIEGVIVHNFEGSGIRTPVSQKLANTTITDTQVYQVGDAGIRLGDDYDTQGAQLHTNLYIGNCYVYDTSGYNANDLHHGDGILVQCAKTVTIEYCEVHDTATAFGAAATGGPAGIWLADVAYGTIQYCESYNNSNGSFTTDGDGFDLDGGTQYCVIQYCYSHDNDGAGFLQAHWATSSETASSTINNTIRYNISINDTKHTSQAALSYWSENAAATLNNCAYNNLVVQTASGRTNACVDQENTDGTAANPTRIYNNIFVTDYSHYLAKASNTSNFIINDNVWWSLDNTFDYSAGSLASTDPLGIQADPLINGEPSALLTAPTVGYANIDNIETALTGDFEENTGSPATDSGLNLSLAAYGSQNVGTQDFFGTSIPQNNLFDIGPYEQVNAFSGTVISDVSSSPGVTLSGAWTTSTSTAGYYGRYYLTDGDAGSGKSIQFTPHLPTAGNYQVYAWWTAASNRATNVPISIVNASGTTNIQVNEQATGGQWVSLGTYAFNSGTGGYVTISDTGANGYVIANAVKFVQQ